MTPLRCGMTLVELLVVIALLSILVTTAIPVLSPGGDSRRVREASRAVNAFLSGAQARAAETGRPFGVAFKRLSTNTLSADDNGVCIELYYVETPLPFSGFDGGSRVRVCASPAYNPALDTNPADPDDVGPFWLQLVRTNGGASAQRLPPGFAFDLFPPAFLRPGDVVEVRGRSYELLNGDGTATRAARTTDSGANVAGYFEGSTGVGAGVALPFLAQPVGAAASTPLGSLPALSPQHDNSGATLPPPEVLRTLSQEDVPPAPYWESPATYKVLRQPTPATTPPLQLAAGGAIDLSASGFMGFTPLYRPSMAYSTSDSEFRVWTLPDVVMFSPQGTVHRAVTSAPGSTGPGSQALVSSTITSTLALCVGMREKVPAPATDQAKTRYAQVAPRADEPIDVALDALGLKDQPLRELYDRYNWLSLDSRWVVVGGQSGSVSTVANAFVSPKFDADRNGSPDANLNLAAQLTAARENAPRRVAQGGR
ncbi:MAG: pilus assembly FimT family protein [Lacipirellulaceae bacterium]